MQWGRARRTTSVDPARGLRAWAVLGVVLLLLLTLAATLVTREAVDRHQRTRFDAQVERLTTALEERMSAYVQVLRGGAGLFETSQEVTRVEWDAYVDNLRLDERYPGFKSLSYAEAVATTDLDALVARVRAERVPRGFGTDQPLRDYALRGPDGSDGETDLHSPIVYVAPWVPENHTVLGVDMMLEPRRRATMLAAARTGRPATSPGLVLAGSADREAGFIVYLPVRDDGRLRGWLTAAFLAQRFVAGLDEARATDLDLEVWDRSGEDGVLLWSSADTRTDGSPVPLAVAADALTAERTVPVPGGAWRARFVSPPGFATASEVVLPWLVLTAGLLTTLVAVLLLRGAVRWRRVADLLEEQSRGLHAARAAAEEAAEAKSRFLATMSHEIRNPLMSVHASVDALQREPLHGDQARYASIIARGSQHLLGVVNHLLDWSTVESDEVVLTPREVDVAELVADVLVLTGPVAEQGGLRLRAEVEEGLRATVDDERLTQVLLNLVSNAVRFTERGGEVRVRAVRHHHDDRDGDDQLLLLEVSDTGVGIAADDLERIFDPYAQAGADSPARRSGTGLGLAICRHLVAAMGGTIEVSSRVGEGTTFTVLVPAGHPHPQDGTAASQEVGSLVGSGSPDIL